LARPLGGIVADCRQLSTVLVRLCVVGRASLWLITTLRARPLAFCVPSAAVSLHSDGTPFLALLRRQNSGRRTQSLHPIQTQGRMSVLGFLQSCLDRS